MAATVALVSTRPETFAADLARLLALAGLSSEGDLALLAPPPHRGPTPAGGLMPWLLDGLAAGGGPEAEFTLCHPRTGPAEPADGAWPLSPAFLTGTWNVGQRAWCLGGARLHRRVRLVGPLAVALAHLVPEQNPARLVRRPERLRTVLKELAPRRPEAAVLDLTVCADGPEPVALNLLLAGLDLVACETVACQLLGIAPLSAPLLCAAEAAGWGQSRDLTVVGDLQPQVVTRSRTAALDPGGWTLDDAPEWLGRLACAWRRWGPAGRGPRRRFETLAWGRLWREPRNPA